MSTILERPAYPSVRRRPLGHRPTLARGTGLGRGLGSLAQTVLGHLFSFEMVMVLYIYSNVFQTILPPLPIDSTIILFVLSIGIGGLVVLKEGIYLRGFSLVMAYLPYLFWAA